MTTQTQQRWWYGLLGILFSLALGLRLWGLNVPGETWDEIAYYNAAHRYYNNVQNRVWEADAWDANKEHPAVAKWLYAAVSIGPFQDDEADFVPGRILSAALGSLTVVLTALIGAQLYSRRVGLLAALILALLPPWIALNRVFGLDTPTAFFFALSTWLLLGGLSRERGAGWWYAAASIAVGLAIGTRLSNVLLLPFLGMAVLLYRFPAWLAGRQRGELWWVLAFVLVPAGVVYGTWPWLWEDTRAHWELTIGHWSPVTNMFLGVIQYPGPSYFLMYALVSLPALLVLLVVWHIARTLVRGTRSDWLVLLWVLAVFAFSAYGLRQGGIRYLAQMFPALALAGAVMLDDVLRRLQSRKLWSGLLALAVGYFMFHALWYQPYQLDYYNELTGGLARVERERLFQVGWWNEGVEQAVLWLNSRAPTGASVWYAAVPDRSQWQLRPDFVRTVAFPDYIILNPVARWQVSEWPTLSSYHLVHSIAVHGVNLAEIWQRIE